MKKYFLIIFMTMLVVLSINVYAEDEECDVTHTGGSAKISYITNTSEMLDDDSVCTTCGDASSFELKLPTSYGEKFDGWYAEDSFTHKIESLSDLDSSYAYEHDDCNNVYKYKLYAKWSEANCSQGVEEFEINFDSNGGNEIEKIIGTAEFGSDFSNVIFETPIRPGYEFAGWYNKSDTDFSTRINSFKDDMEKINFSYRYNLNGCPTILVANLKAKWEKMQGRGSSAPIDNKDNTDNSEIVGVEDTASIVNNIWYVISFLVLVVGSSIMYLVLDSKREKNTD